MRCGMKNNKYAIVLLMVGFISLTAVRGFAGSVSMDYHDNSRTIEKGAGSQTAGIYATAGENGYILMSAGIVSAGTSDVLTVDRGTSQSITIVPYNKGKWGHPLKATLSRARNNPLVKRVFLRLCRQLPSLRYT